MSYSAPMSRRSRPEVRTQSAPERDDGYKRESGGEVACELVVAGCDAAEVLEAAEYRLHPPAVAIAPLVEVDLAFAGTGARDDHADARLAQILAQPVGIVALVGDQAVYRAGRLGQHGGRGLHVAGVAGAEVDDARAADHVGEDVDLGGRPRP